MSLIRFYRIFLSPVFGGQCRFYPSCSRYAEEAFRSNPWWRALGMSLKRLLKCHPYYEGE